MKNIRNKTKEGKFVAKRVDTKINTIEKKYNINLGVRSDMELGEYLKLKGFPSLSAMLAKK
jgi:hypothetical protein